MEREKGADSSAPFVYLGIDERVDAAQPPNRLAVDERPQNLRANALDREQRAGPSSKIGAPRFELGTSSPPD